MVRGGREGRERCAVVRPGEILLPRKGISAEGARPFSLPRGGIIFPRDYELGKITSLVVTKAQDAIFTISLRARLNNNIEVFPRNAYRVRLLSPDLSAVDCRSANCFHIVRFAQLRRARGREIPRYCKIERSCDSCDFTRETTCASGKDVARMPGEATRPGASRPLELPFRGFSLSYLRCVINSAFRDGTGPDGVHLSRKRGKIRARFFPPFVRHVATRRVGRGRLAMYETTLFKY